MFGLIDFLLLLLLLLIFLGFVSNQTMHSVCQFGWIDKGTIRHFSPTCNHNTIDDRSRLYYFSGLFSLVLFAFAVLCCAVLLTLSPYRHHVIHCSCKSNTYTQMRHRCTHTTITVLPLISTLLPSATSLLSHWIHWTVLKTK